MVAAALKCCETTAMLAIAASIQSRRHDLSTEAAAQASLARGFASDGIAAERETWLGPGERPDFIIGGVAIEVKVKGAAMKIFRQLERYATHERVTGLILVTSKSMGAPALIGGKPCLVVSLGKAWL